MTDVQTFQAVCGQRCGPVTVASLDVKNCPQCGHPLTGPPTVAGKASVGDQSGSSGGDTSGANAAAAGAPAATIAGAPIVEVPPVTSTQATPGPSIAGAPVIPIVPPAAMPQTPPVDAEVNLAYALELVGFSADEAKDAAHDAVTEIARRKAATS